jgi:hypothetical protein
MTVVGFNFCRCAIVEFSVEPFLVEPGHPGAGGDFQVVEPLPGPTDGGRDLAS